MIIELFKKVFDNYLAEKNNAERVHTGLNCYKELVHNIPDRIKELLNLNQHIKIKGSIGEVNFNIANHPWICFFDKRITNSAKRGYYPVILFKSDMSGFYLSLNQGWTQYTDIEGFSTQESKELILRNSNIIKKRLIDLKGFNSEPINLISKSKLADGYELGNICSKYYASNNMPTEETFKNDIQKILELYENLYNIIGADIFNIETEINEEEYQKEINSRNEDSRVLPDGPIEKEINTGNGSISKYKRKVWISKKVLKDSNYLCQYDSAHLSFISNKTNNQYVEAHHLIPVSEYYNFSYSLDVYENIVSLCPNCHKLIHHGKLVDKKRLLRKFYLERKDILLSNRCINLKYRDLLKMYLDNNKN